MKTPSNNNTPVPDYASGILTNIDQLISQLQSFGKELEANPQFLLENHRYGLLDRLLTYVIQTINFIRMS